MWSNADPLQSPERQLRGGLCVDLALAVLDGPKRPDLQTRVLGQDPRARHVDEQVRSDHDVPADGDSAPGRAPPHLPHGNDITLFYTFSDYGGGNREYRMIPTDGRQHNANQARQATYLGYSVGKWEGDTLVVDSISFVDSTWLGRGGLFHSGDMRIVEKFTRKGNEILHEMTIHDPESFVVRAARGGGGGKIEPPHRVGPPSHPRTTAPASTR